MPRATWHAGLFEPRRIGVERGGVGDLPAEEADTLAAVLADDDALLAVVHAEREALGALVDQLHAEEAGPEVRPVLQRLGANADVSETFDRHGPPPRIVQLICVKYGPSRQSWQLCRGPHPRHRLRYSAATFAGLACAEIR